MIGYERETVGLVEMVGIGCQWRGVTRYGQSEENGENMIASDCEVIRHG